MAFGIGPTASNLLANYNPTRSPFGPAGITDMQRQAMLTGMQGYGSQYDAGQQHANDMRNAANQASNYYHSGQQGQGFGWNDAMYSAGNMAEAAWDPSRFNDASNMVGRGEHALYAAQNNLGANPYVQGRLGQFQGAPQTAGMMNTIGASFDPWNDRLESSISSANQQLGRDFNQSVMPQMNRAAIASGAGGYGGTRAGVAQGLREQGLSDAMQRQTTDMASQGYEAGLGRYVQDRANTLGATGQEMSNIRDSAMRGHDIDSSNRVAAMNSVNQYYNNAAGNLANIAGNYGQQQIGAANAMGTLGRDARQMQNQADQWGLGNMAEQYQNAYRAGMAPGQSMLDMGQQMGQFGMMQQTQNQRQLDHMNQQYNNAANGPQQGFSNYLSNIHSIANPYGQQSSSTAPAPNMFNQAIGGASAGYGLYDAWNQSQQGPTGVPAGQQGPLTQNGTWW